MDIEHLTAVAHGAGIDLVGACRAAAWTSTRSHLEQRKAAGVNDTMAFTYKNPARSSDPTRVLNGASTLIVAAMSYVQDPSDAATAPSDIAVAAQVAAYATADHYGRLAAGLEVVASELRQRGARAVVVLDRNDVVDREAAWRAGIGWYGKNSLLLAPGWGSWVVLGSVVTDARLVEHTPIPVTDHCGPCRRCVDACPTDAIVADGVVDARRCLSWLLQAPGSFPVNYREALGDRIYGCDDCQVVCPPNRAVELRSVRRGTARSDRDPGRWLDAIELADLDDETLLARCGRWYIAGRDPNIVRRNLLIVIANAADPASTDARRVLERFRHGDDPLLAEHATWALGRLERRGSGGGADGLRQ